MKVRSRFFAPPAALGLLAAAALNVGCDDEETAATTTCGDGTVLEAGECVASNVIACGQGTVLSGGVCVTEDPLVCGEGTVRSGTACVPGVTSPRTCGEGTTEVDGACVAEAGLTCGDGTTAVDGECKPSITQIECGAGTKLVGGACTPSALEPGRFQNPFVQLQSLHEVGSHTDEVRLREDGLLLNCSYTFNVIDATDPADMERTHEHELRHVVPNSDRTPGCKHLAWEGDLVFTTHLGNIRNPAFLSGWDISDPENPVQLPVLQEPGVSYESVDVANGHIFVALHDQGLGVYDYDGATGFTRVGSLGGFTNAWGLAARGPYVYVGDGVGGLVVVDATDPAAPKEAGRVDFPGQAKFVALEGNYAYVAAGSEGAVVVDVTDPAAPKVVSTIEMPGTALRLAVSEGRLFAAAWNDVRAYDVSTPASPKFIAALRIPRDYGYDNIDREKPTMRIFGVAAKGLDVFIGTWENPYSYRLDPTRLAPNLRLPEQAARVDFGPVASGTTKTLDFEVKNQGTAPLTITESWTTNPDFAVTPSSLRLQPGESAVLELAFTSKAAAPVEAFMNIRSDDPAYPVRKVYLVANPEGISIGAPLPATVGTMVDGTTWKSEDAKGKVLLLAYWATYCPVCANHLPDLEERFYQRYAAEGLEVVALNPKETPEQISQIINYTENIVVNYPIGVEEGAVTYEAIMANFPGPNPFPVDVIVDRDGIVRYATHEYDPDAMQVVIEGLLAE